MDRGIILDFQQTVWFDLIFTSQIPLFQEHTVFKIIEYLQSSIMPKGSPSPVRLCRSCLRRFGDLNKKHAPGFGNMYYGFCDF